MNQPRRKMNLVLLLFVVTFGSYLGFAVIPSIEAAGPCVAGPHGGVINTDQSWCVANNPHIMTGTVTVANGATLTIEPGVEVRTSGADTSLVVSGTLDAQGTSTDGILFTTNNIIPAGGQWRQIVFNPSSSGNMLDYVTIEYGGFFRPMVDVRTDDLTVSNTIIRNSADIGMQLNDASPTISTTTFTDNSGRALDLTGASFPTLNELSATGNDFNGVSVNGTTITEDYTWGQGMNVYLIRSSVEVANDVTLDVLPGTTVGFIGEDTTITVDGTLDAQGTSSEPIRFTSAQSTPAPGLWRKIVFNSLSTDNVLDHVTIEYGGYFQPMVDVRTDDLTVSNTIIRESADIGMQLNDASPTISTTTFTDNAQRALELSGSSFPTLSELSASGNSFNGVAITGTTITEDYTWGQGSDNYLVAGSVMLNPDTTLDVVPGTTVQFIGEDTTITVDGTFTAVGTADDSILFTSGRPTPVPGQWKQIVFNDDSQNSVLEYVTVEYGGYFDPVIAIGTSSVSIRNSTIARSADAGIEVFAGSPTITNNNIVENMIWGLRNTSSGTVRATCNWWGDASGPTNDANPDGLGQIVSDNVIFNPWLTAEAPDDTCRSTTGSGVIYLPLLLR